MRILFFTFLILSITLSAKESSQKASKVSTLKEKYPYGLLTDDYGHLTEEDLLEDMKDANPRPYRLDSKMDGGFFRWQCFPVKDVKPKYRYWKDTDPLGYAHVIVTMCDFEFTVQDRKIKHLYHGRRAKEQTYCNDFKKHFERITKNEKYICLNGEPRSLETDKTTNTQTKYWVWNRIKTKKGCHSYFGDCEK